MRPNQRAISLDEARYILAKIKEAEETGKSLTQLAKELNISNATLFRIKKREGRYSALEVPEETLEELQDTLINSNVLTSKAELLSALVKEQNKYSKLEEDYIILQTKVMNIKLEKLDPDNRTSLEKQELKLAQINPDFKKVLLELEIVRKLKEKSSKKLDTLKAILYSLK